mmetsp:Transcript_16300/g.62020  ORF Transcript_16300/g.62020 Transcript_16300/m.62020 type:complete len:208 (-) Transcript_16300:16-639(-)|eukprot:scaffold57_cov254-Pinguiococcus_pyrenoidosus.AAC.57
MRRRAPPSADLDWLWTKWTFSSYLGKHSRRHVGAPSAARAFVRSNASAGAYISRQASISESRLDSRDVQSSSASLGPPLPSAFALPSRIDVTNTLGDTTAFAAATDQRERLLPRLVAPARSSSRNGDWSSSSGPPATGAAPLPSCASCGSLKSPAGSPLRSTISTLSTASAGAQFSASLSRSDAAFSARGCEKTCASACSLGTPHTT